MVGNRLDWLPPESWEDWAGEFALEAGRIRVEYGLDWFRPRGMKTPLTLLAVAVVSALLLASCASDPYYYSGGTVSYDRGGRYDSVGYTADYYDDYSIYRSYWSDWGVPFSAGVIAGAIFLGWDDHRHCYTYYYPRCSHCGYYPCRGGHRPYYRPHYRYHKQPLHPSHRGARHAKRKLYHPPAVRPHSGSIFSSVVVTAL